MAPSSRLKTMGPFLASAAEKSGLHAAQVDGVERGARAAGAREVLVDGADVGVADEAGA